MFLIQRVILKLQYRSAIYNYYCDMANEHYAKDVREIKINRKITAQDVETFSKLTGDDNPIHSKIVHGALLNSLVSGVIGSKLPGPGTIVINQYLNYPNPCFVGSTVQITVILTEVRKIIKCKYTCIRDDNKTVLEGEAKLILKKK